MMRSLLAPLCLIGLIGCGAEAPTPAPWPPEPTDPRIAAGAKVWKQDCRRCHSIGREGAPVFGDRAVWAERIAKGADVLYKHAIEGWYAPSMAEMPAKGGNDELTDDQVRSAVDYMIWAATDAPPKPEPLP